MLQLAVEVIFDLADGGLVELVHGLSLGILVDLLELTLEHRAPLRELIVKELLKYLVGILHGLLTLILADVGPRGFDRGDGTCVDRVDVRFGKVVQHLAVEGLGVELLRLDPVHDLPPKCMHLLDELRPQILKWNISQILQLVLLGQWSDHSATVTFFEEGFEKATDAILLVDGLREAFLGLEGLLEVVF